MPSPLKGLLLPEFINISHTPGKNPLFSAKFFNLKFENSHVLHPLVVLALAFIQHGLLDLDLLIEQSQLVIAPDKLRPEDISLTGDLERQGKAWPSGKQKVSFSLWQPLSSHQRSLKCPCVLGVQWAGHWKDPARQSTQLLPCVCSPMGKRKVQQILHHHHHHPIFLGLWVFFCLFSQPILL